MAYKKVKFAWISSMVQWVVTIIWAIQKSCQLAKDLMSNPLVQRWWRRIWGKGSLTILKLEDLILNYLLLLIKPHLVIRKKGKIIWNRIKKLNINLLNTKETMKESTQILKSGALKTEERTLTIPFYHLFLTLIITIL